MTFDGKRLKRTAGLNLPKATNIVFQTPLISKLGQGKLVTYYDNSEGKDKGNYDNFCYICFEIKP